MLTPARLLLLASLAALPLHPASAQSAGQTSAPQSTRATPPAPDVLAARLDSVVRTDILPRGFPSVSVAVTRGGRPVLTRAWGVANVATGQRADTSTLYNVGSIAKQFTAALVLKLADRKKLSVTDSIGRHLEGLPPEWSALPIEQLLNHTSGAPRSYETPTRPDESVSGETLLAAATKQPLAATPGTVWTYSNTGYLLLGVLVEKKYGKSYGTVLRDEIAKPLGLASLGWCGDAAQERLAAGYLRSSDGKASPRGSVHPSHALGSGSICSTASDIAKWNVALHNGRVVSAASYSAMTTPRGAVASAKGYGFGVLRESSEWGSPAIVHDGQDVGFTVHNAWFPAESLSVTMLYNALPYIEVPSANFVAQLALGLTPRPMPPIRTITLPLAATQGEGRPKFVGAYELAVGRAFIVTFEEGQLWVTPPGSSAKQPLFLQAGTTYALGKPDGTTTVTFHVDASGEISGFTARDNGVDRVLRKVK